MDNVLKHNIFMMFIIKYPGCKICKQLNQDIEERRHTYTYVYVYIYVPYILKTEQNDEGKCSEINQEKTSMTNIQQESQLTGRKHKILQKKPYKLYWRQMRRFVYK
jgi:thioredoxin-related protein